MSNTLYRWKEIISKDDLPKEAGRYHVRNEKTFGEAYAFFESGAFGGHGLDNITNYLVKVEADQQELWQQLREFVAIRGKDFEILSPGTCEQLAKKFQLILKQ